MEGWSTEESKNEPSKTNDLELPIDERTDGESAVRLIWTMGLVNALANRFCVRLRMNPLKKPF